MAYIDYTAQKNALLSQLGAIEKAERSQLEAQLKRAKELALAELKLKEAQDNLVAFNKGLAAVVTAVSNAALELKLLKDSGPLSTPVNPDKESLRKFKEKLAHKNLYQEAKELCKWIVAHGHTPVNKACGAVTPLRKQKDAILAAMDAAFLTAAENDTESVTTVDASEDALIPWSSPNGTTYMRVGHINGRSFEVVWHERGDLWLENKNGSKGAYAGVLLANGKIDACPATLADEPEI